MTRGRLTCLLASLAFLAAGAYAAEQDFAKVAKALGLAENARTEDVLKAIERLKVPARAPETSAVGKAEAAAAQRAAGAAEPVLGVSEKKGQWYGRAEALLLTRTIWGQDGLLTFSRFNPDGNVGADGNEVAALSTGDIGFGYSPGMRLTLGYQFNNSTSLELSYFGLQQWEDGHSTPNYNNVAGDDGLDARLPFLMSIESGDYRDDFFNSDQQWFKYNAWVHSGALDVRYQTSGMGAFTPTLTAGIRYLNIGDEFKFYSRDDTPRRDANVGVYRVAVDNHLIGLQVGSEITHPFNDWVSAGVKIKGGLLANVVDQDTRVTNLGGGANARYFITHGDDGKVGLAGLVEAGAFATFRPHKHIDLRIGYEALFVAGVAVAPMQNTAQQGASAAPRAMLNNSSSLLYHGPSLGLTFRW
jgi:hypothetical protein